MAWETGLAIYGAIVATVVGVVQLLNYLRDRVGVKVTATCAFIPTGRLEGETQDIVLLRAVNIGRRPVTLMSGCLELSNGHSLLATAHLGKALPCTISEGEECSLYIPIASLFQTEDLAKLVVAVVFRDAADRQFRCPFRLPAPD